MNGKMIHMNRGEDDLYPELVEMNYLMDEMNRLTDHMN